MPTNRQDAWSQDEDLLLAEIVLRHIREGGTQLQAFDEVGKLLSRTSAACGFRWNSYVRKQYQAAIELAKNQRKELRNNLQSGIQTTKDLSPPINSPEKGEGKKVLSFDELVSFLKTMYTQYEASSEQTERIREYEENAVQLESKYYLLQEENEKLKKDMVTIQQDYKALIEILDKARKMMVLHDDERQQKVKFQMDQNGNLERIEK